MCDCGALGCLFFFQAEDGIRDADVTGVQTCALPIYLGPGLAQDVQALVFERLEVVQRSAPLRDHPRGPRASTASRSPAAYAGPWPFSGRPWWTILGPTAGNMLKTTLSPCASRLISFRIFRASMSYSVMWVGLSTSRNTCLTQLTCSLNRVLRTRVKATHTRRLSRTMTPRHHPRRAFASLSIVLRSTTRSTRSASWPTMTRVPSTVVK